MGIIKFFYAKNSFKRKILEIKDEIKDIVQPLCKEYFWIDYYGAYEIEPKNLVFWICVKSDKVKKELSSNEELFSKIRNLLVVYDYPVGARDHVHIGVESQQTVDRESKGNWYVHFK